MRLHFEFNPTAPYPPRSGFVQLHAAPGRASERCALSSVISGRRWAWTLGVIRAGLRLGAECTIVRPLYEGGRLVSDSVDPGALYGEYTVLAMNDIAQLILISQSLREIARQFRSI